MSTIYRYAARINQVGLVDRAERELSHYAYTRTTEWLKQWTVGNNFTIGNNFKAVLGEDLNDCVQRLRNQLQRGLVPSWLSDSGVKPEHFEFTLSGTEVSESGEFWSSFSLQVGSSHKVGTKE
jgi:hypothetical protein